MEVVGADGLHVGTVDHVEGEQIKLTRRDSDDNRHHYIPTDWVASVSGNEARLDKSAEEAKAEWTEADEGETSGNGT